MSAQVTPLRAASLPLPANVVAIQAGGARPAASPALARLAGPFDGPIKQFISYCRIECGFAEATLRAYALDLRDLWVWMEDHGQRDWKALTMDRVCHRPSARQATRAFR